MLIVSVPSVDFTHFEKFKNNNVKIIRDEDYAKDYITDQEYWGLSSGYINQEICKLAFHEFCEYENYLCIDSDVRFIKDFRVSDFMYNSQYPYTVLVMDKDLYTKKFYSKYASFRKELITRIFNYLDYDDKRYLTCHGMTVLNRRVLKDFKRRFMLKRRLKYIDLIAISPYEFTWYNVWLQKNNYKYYAVEPFFKTFHSGIEYNMSRLSLVRLEDIRTHYIGIVMNSNWNKGNKILKYRDPGILCKLLYNFIRIFSESGRL